MSPIRYPYVSHIDAAINDDRTSGNDRFSVHFDLVTMSYTVGRPLAQKNNDDIDADEPTILLASLANIMYKCTNDPNINKIGRAHV